MPEIVKFISRLIQCEGHSTVEKATIRHIIPAMRSHAFNERPIFAVYGATNSEINPVLPFLRDRAAGGYKAFRFADGPSPDLLRLLPCEGQQLDRKSVV